MTEGRVPLAAAVQMQSGDDVAGNLEQARGLLEEASAKGAALAVLPENFALMAKRSREKTAIAEQPGKGPIQAFLAETARSLDLWIVAGSLPLVSPDARRTYGASLVFDPDGTLKAVYRKIHLFDVDLADSNESYRESRSMYPGDDIVVVPTPLGTLGLSICYDLRFPELYRELVDAGATVLSVPAAFTETTGRAHWHTLLKARAVENLAYVIAPGQTGTHPDERRTYGHSVIVDPWGKVLGELEQGSGVVVAPIDLARTERLRKEFPALTNRRLSGAQSDRDDEPN